MVIKNTGKDTLRDLKYVWFMDWSDHKGALVPELDWSDVPNVTKTVKLRDDYVAEATYSLNGLVLLPGQEKHLNTRFHMDNYTEFDVHNDWSYAGLGSSENGFVALFSGAQRIWGSDAMNPNLANLHRELQVRTVVKQHLSNTLGIDAFVTNTGTVPLTRVLVKWISSTAGRTAASAVSVDWSDVTGLNARVGAATNGKQDVVFDFGNQVIGVGETKTIKFRLHSADWTPVDWAQDPSYAGLGKQDDINDQLAMVLTGYPVNPNGDGNVDTDGDGYANALEVLLGSDPNDAGSVPGGAAKITDVIVSDTAASHTSIYDFSSVGGYSSRTAVPVTFAAGSVLGLVPAISVRDLGTLPPPTFDTALWIGKILEIQGSLLPGTSAEMAFPLPDQIPLGLGNYDVQLLHYVNGKWKKESVTKVENGAVYANVTSFSPFAVGIRLRISGLSAYGKHALGVDKSGTVWSMGGNDRGQLGIGSTDAAMHQRLEWISRLSGSGIAAVAAGRQHSLALDLSGNIWAWGDNTYGQIGVAISPDTIRNAISSPVKVWDASVQGTGAVAIIAGGWSSYALLADGRCVAWGRNQRGQLGLGDTLNRDIPTALALTGVRILAAGDAHAVTVIDGNIFAWGDDTKAQLGRRSTSNNAVTLPVKIPFNLLEFGYKRVTYSYSGSGPNGEGSGGGYFDIPYLNPPSEAYASGSYSAVRCPAPNTRGYMAPVIGWGDNAKGQISPSIDSSILLAPKTIFSSAHDIGVFGMNHTVRSEDRGFTYFDTTIGGRFIYAVMAQGSNLNGESGPDSLGKAKVSWKNILLPGTRRNLESVLMAAGDGFSVAVNRVNDSVYAWGGAFGAAGVATKLSESRNPPIVNIVSPVDGAKITALVTPVAWTADGVNQTAGTQETLTLGWNRIQRTFTKSTGEVGSASIQVYADTAKAVLHIVSPSRDTVVTASNIVVRYLANGVSYDTIVALTVGANRIVVSRNGVQDSIKIIRTSGSALAALAVAPRVIFAYTNVTISGAGSLVPVGVTPLYSLQQIGGASVRISGEDGRYDFLAKTPDTLVFELTLADSAGRFASSKDTVSLVVREPVTLWEKLQVLQNGQNHSEGNHSISITDPSGDWSFAVATDTIALSGVVDLDSLARQISWSRTGGKAGFVTAPNREWLHPDLVLNKGDNLLRYTYQDDSGKMAVTHALATYWDSIFITEIAISPEHFYSGQNLTHQVRVRGQFESGLQRLELVQVTVNGNQVLTQLNDAGNLSDSIADDGIWSGSFQFQADTGETIYLRIRATYSTGMYESQIRSWVSQPEITQAHLDRVGLLNDSTDALYSSLEARIGIATAKDSVLTWLKSHSGVRAAGTSPDGMSLSWIHQSGVYAAIVRAPEGMMGKIGVKALGAIQESLNFAKEWRDTLNTWEAAEPQIWNITSQTDSLTAAKSLAGWNDWEDRKAVFLAAHGAVWGLGAQRAYDLGENTSKPIYGNFLVSGLIDSFISRRNKDGFRSEDGKKFPKYVFCTKGRIGLTAEYFKSQYSRKLDGTLLYLGSCQGGLNQISRVLKSGKVITTKDVFTFANEVTSGRFGGKRAALVGFTDWVPGYVVRLAGLELMKQLRKGIDLKSAMDSLYNTKALTQLGVSCATSSARNCFDAVKHTNGRFLSWKGIFYPDSIPSHAYTFDVQLRYYGDSSFTLIPSIKAAGNNSWGQLGTGNRVDTASLVSVQNSGDMISVAASHAASAGLLASGKVLTWGSNNNGELGNNDTTIKIRLRPDTVVYMSGGMIKSLPGIRSIRGENFGPATARLQDDGRFVALDSSGKVWTWGKNDLGQTGLASSLATPRAKSIFGSGLIGTQIETGTTHGVVLFSDGTVGGYGYGLGIGLGVSSNGNTIETQKQGTGQVVLRNVGLTCPEAGTQNRILHGISYVGAGGYISFAISADDIVYAWGDNRYYQAGIEWNDTYGISGCALEVGPLSGKGLKAISAGSWHTLALDRNGKIWGFGMNMNGAIGLPGISAAMSRLGIGFIKPTRLPLDGTFVKVSAGDGFSAALDVDGNAYVWGRNDQGQLGLGHRRDVLTPQKLPGKYSDITAGTAHILAIPR